MKEKNSTRLALLSSFFDSRSGTPFTYSTYSSGIKIDTTQKKNFTSSYDAISVVVKKTKVIVNQIIAI
ncbi:MAG: hypothetical protein NHB15_12885 [Methanosarcina barkeri]|nr:hypothetical protein [Methanosarcina sp. ERenArc_MAG2]